MKRILTILAVLVVSVMTTACINNLAIQELNNKAKAYMEAGETDKAICRYKASLDLDDSIFETNYNLGVAYVTAKKYDEAVEALKNAIKIDSTVADSYYSLAVALENIAYNKINGEDEKADEEVEQKDEVVDNVSAVDQQPQELTTEQKETISKLLMDSIENYNQYLSHNPVANDKDKVSAKVDELNKELLKYSVNAPVQEEPED